MKHALWALVLLHCTPVITILQTSDLHGNVRAWDYYAGKADPKRGLAKVATLVRAQRTKCTLLIDTGDTIAGSPLAATAMAAAMNEVGYDAMVLGNHDFDDLEALRAFMVAAKFPVLAANVADVPAAIVKDVCGVKVAILGLTTSMVPGSKDALETATREVPLLKADRVIVAIHAGPDKRGKLSDDYSAWEDRGNLPGENQAVQIAEQVPGVDLVLSGHTHEAIPELRFGQVIVTQPARYGSHLGVSTFDHARLVAVEASTLEDPAVVTAVKDAHEAALVRVETPIGTSKRELGGAGLAEVLNRAQEAAALKAGFPVEVSLASVFGDAKIPEGDVRLRDAYAVYPYDNTLAVMEVSGAVLRAAVARGSDVYRGLPAEINPVKRYRLALNSYRASGGGGFAMFREGKVLWRSSELIRDMLIAALAEGH